MTRSKFFVRGWLVLLLVAGLLASAIVPMFASVGAAPVYPAVPTMDCSNLTIAKWNFDGSSLMPSTGNGTLVFVPGIIGPTFLPGSTGTPSPDQSISFTNWTTSSILDPSQYLEFDVSTVGRNSINLSFDYLSENNGPTKMDVYYSLNGGNNYLFFQTINLTNGSPWQLAQNIGFTLTDQLNDNLDARFRLYAYAASSSLSALDLDNITFSGNCIPTPPPTQTNTPTPITPTRTNTPTGFHPQVMINEVGWSGTKADPNAQWVELYNPGTVDIDLNGWILQAPDGSPKILLSGIIPALGYYLLVHGTSSQATSTPTLPPTTTPPACIVFNPADVGYNQIFADNLNVAGETLYLINPSDLIVDYADRNGGPWPAGSFSNNASMERRGVVPDSLSAWITYANITGTVRDCGGNRVFGTPKQQNWAWGQVQTPSPTPKPHKTATTRPPTLAPKLVINEFLPRPSSDWNGDGQVNVYDEFIEVENLGPGVINLSGWRLDDLPKGGAGSFTLPNMKLNVGQRAVFYGLTTHILLQDSGETVRLISPFGVVMDARTYGPVKSPDVTHCRIPDGIGYWRDDCFPTPGNENALTGAAPAAPPVVAAGPPPCLLPDTTPLEFVLAVCSPFGQDIWNQALWDDAAGEGEFIVPDDLSKWETIVE